MKRRNLLIPLILGFLLSSTARAAGDEWSHDSDAVVRSEAADPEGAAQAAGGNNTATHDTPAWYQQSAVELSRYAGFLKDAQHRTDARRAAHAAESVLLHALAATAATANSSEQAQFYVQLGLLYWSVLGDPVNARTAFETAYKLAPKNPIARRAVAGFAADDANRKRFNRGGQ